ncbi:MAG: GIY-YIG nuclease family protein [Armatimonadetes bacterium]|nr:GIY-YIG nuclease family protein [Armatimonadota bacterium]
MSKRPGFAIPRPLTRIDDAGVYALCVRLQHPVWAKIGALGWHRFEAGLYIYFGTAQRGLSARLARHFSKAKRLRWHIDYLTVHASCVGALLWRAPRERECDGAQAAAKVWPCPVARFGSSDCGCAAHLFGPAPEDWALRLERVLGPPEAMIMCHGLGSQ